MDPAENLLAIVYSTDEDNIFIDLGALAKDGAHPRIAGPTLFLSERPEGGGWVQWRLTGFGRHIAVRHTVGIGEWPVGNTWKTAWWMQIWDWQRSTISNVSFG
jgi:hypothetical protein